MGRVVDAVKDAREFLFTSFFGRELVGRHLVASTACAQRCTWGHRSCRVSARSWAVSEEGGIMKAWSVAVGLRTSYVSGRERAPRLPPGSPGFEHVIFYEER